VNNAGLDPFRGSPEQAPEALRAMKTILLAYERDQDFASVETLLVARGHRVLKARSGVEALEIARHDPPHVVVSDVLLPRLDGFALCRRLKEDPLLQHVPVVMHSFRVEGAKYESFAAEVGAERFMARGATLEELAEFIEKQNAGSGTMRMPALVPELLEKRERDRRRLSELEARLREIETANQQHQAANRELEAAERQLRERLEQEQRQRAELVATDSDKIRELQARVVDLERTRNELARAETRAREAAEKARAESARIPELEKQLGQLGADRDRVQAEAADVRKLLAEREAALERALSDAQAGDALRTRALDGSPVPSCIVDGEGCLSYANPALATLLAQDAEELKGRRISDFELRSSGAETTIRAAAIGGDGQVLQEQRWQRGDGSVLEVEIAASPLGEPAGFRVVAVRDVTHRKRATRRAELDQKCLGSLVDLAQRGQSLAESEIQRISVDIAAQVTGAQHAFLFLALPEPKQLELAARLDLEDQGSLARWRGSPPADSALLECLESQQPVLRDVPEGTGVLVQCGLPGQFARQLAVPLVDGSRVAGALLVADKPTQFDEDDRRRVAQLADVAWRALRRRRSDAEVVSAMDHMERVMLGTVAALAELAERQDANKTGRSHRVADLAAEIGAALGLPGHTVRGLRVAGQLIDVGMLHIPREILWRPGPLAPAEYELVKTHAERGYETLRHIEFPWPVAEVVRQHHERMDGSGYPRGLKAEEILLESRIVAVADAVEAMLAPRPQRAALTTADCIEELQSRAGRRYDARVVKACVKLLREREDRLAGEALRSRIA
jgi:PAS domain S-box-containing protein